MQTSRANLLSFRALNMADRGQRQTIYVYVSTYTVRTAVQYSSCSIFHYLCTYVWRAYQLILTNLGNIARETFILPN